MRKESSDAESGATSSGNDVSSASSRLIRPGKGWTRHADPAQDRHFSSKATEADAGVQDVSSSSQDHVVRAENFTKQQADPKHQELRHNTTETSTEPSNSSSSRLGHLVRGEEFEKQMSKEPSDGTATRHDSTETSLVHLVREKKFVHHHLNLVADKKKHILRRMETMRTGLEREDFPSDEFEAGTLLGDSRASSRHLMRAAKSMREPAGTHPAPRRPPPGRPGRLAARGGWEGPVAVTPSLLL